MQRFEIKEQTPQLTLLYYVRTTRSSHLLKKLFLKNLQYLQETPVLESFLRKVTDLKASAHNTCCFPVNIAKFLRLPISKNICTQLHFKYLHTVSMVHCYMGLKVQGLDCMAASGFSVFKLF